MERPVVNHEWSDHYEATIHLLKQIQVDYHRARRELHEVSSHFSSREAAVGRQLRSAFDAIEQVGIRRDSGDRVDFGVAPPELEHGGRGAVSGPAIDESVPTLEVYSLGRFQIRVGWNRIERWHSLKAKSLLKYLVAQRGRPVPKDVLMEALWPGCEPSLANNNLKAAVRSLRQTLNWAGDSYREFAWVLFQDGSYMINPEAHLWTDTEQFEYHWHIGRQLEKQGKVDEAIREHETAEALYKGDYLEDDLYEEWTTLRREALKDFYLAILGRLADYSMRTSDYESCIVYCQKILDNDSCREDAYRRLMCSYSRLGNRNRAIGWYHLCERVVTAELDVHPDHQTIALHQRLLNDEYI